MAALAVETEAWTVGRRIVDDLLSELTERAKLVKDPRSVGLIETHISWVLLGPGEVYKIKKPVVLPFVDLSAFEARDCACRTEVRINRRLAPRTYLGVVPVRRGPNGRYTFGTTGAIVEWAVRMTRLDDAQRADLLLAQGNLTPEMIDALAQKVAAFHAECSRAPRISTYGAPEVIERNVLGNFSALHDAGGDFLSHGAMTEVERSQLAFLRGHRDVFERRMLDGAVRDGHGDLRLEHVFLSPKGDFDVIDGIEFDDRYRYADVAADVAFLAMDLARSGRVDLAERFLARYARAANDFDLYSVVDFYEGYRACVQAKLAAATATARLTPEEVVRSATNEARRYLLLAQSARRRPVVPPVLVAIAGGIASGKSTLAELLGRDLGAAIVDADRTRKHMLGLVATDRARAGAWQGPYDPTFSERVYEEVLRRAGVVLASGRPVIVDASFRTPKARAAVEALASTHNVPLRLLECVAPLDVCRARLEARQADRTRVSDASVEILDTFAASFVPITELPPTEHVRIDTTTDPHASLAQAKAVITTWPDGLVQ